MKPTIIDYPAFFDDIKSRVKAAQTRAVFAVNTELVRLYWDIGSLIVQRQQAEGWGAKVIDRLAQDLKSAFPTMRGFSASNLKYMRFFAEQCPDGKIGQQAADQLPWFHVVTLLTQLEKTADRAWYAGEAIAHGWSRTTLQANIKGQLSRRQGQAVSNFIHRLPERDAARAQQALKDPYLFDFLGLADEAHERDIEDALIRHVTRFLLELGAGFAFVARQFRLDVGGDEFFVDLLFLSHATEVLRRRRTQGDRIQTRACRPTEFLPGRDRWAGQGAGRWPDDWLAALQDAKPGGR